MGEPSKHDVEVALDALHDDAKVWSDAAHKIDGARQQAQSVHLTAVQFSYYADKAGVTSTYQDLVEK